MAIVCWPLRKTSLKGSPRIFPLERTLCPPFYRQVSSPKRSASDIYVRPAAALRPVRARLPLPSAERHFLWLAGALLAFLPWPLASNRTVPEFFGLGLAIIAFGFATFRGNPGNESERAGLAAWSAPWRRLTRFPIFWIGAALLVYIFLQALNPDWQFVQNRFYWWLVGVKSVPWLPTSIRAPIDRSNPWRQLAVYGQVWFLVCGLWIGLTRRKSVRILLGVIVADALLLVALLAVQRGGAGDRFPQILSAETSYGLTSSFIGRNQAGAYFDLCAFCALALATWSLDISERNLKKSSPAGVLAVAALLIGGAVLFTWSRGSVLLLAITLPSFGAWFYLRRKRQAVPGLANRRVTLAILAIFAVFLMAAVHYLDFSELARRFNALATERRNEPSVSARLMARSAAIEMWKEHGLRGVGAGGFRELFPQYAKRYPEIYQGGTLFWEHAHCDWLEIPIELGLIGDALLAAAIIWGIVFLIRRNVLWSAVTVPLLLGCSQTMVHAWFDFPFQCTAVLATWCAVATLALKWAELAARRDKS